ncbi:MAG: amidohydrolase family protein [Thermoanaerobaculia bacterium]
MRQGAAILTLILGSGLAAGQGSEQAQAQQLAIRGETVYTMAGEPIEDGVVLVEDGKIRQVGPASRVRIPDGVRIVTGKVVTPGLIDAHSTVGLSGIYNVDHDQD